MRTAPAILLLFVAVILMAPWAASAGALIINHETADIWQIPEAAITQAKATLHIAYGHTSHGSQLISGMGTANGEQLDEFMTNNGATPDLYLWNAGGTNGALDLRDTPFVGAYDLGNPDRYAWEAATRAYLGGHPECNVVLWSWCGQAETTLEEIDIYLNLMEGLIEDYPGVNFVFMTGHLAGTGTHGLLNLANEHIRQHCITHDRVLYDFADIESYDPDHLVYYMPLLCNDNCDYDSDGNGSRDRNWALDWQAGHTEGVDWWASGAAHSQHLNGNLKGYAAWWLWAALAGWSECIEAPSDLAADADPYAQEIALAWTDNSESPDEDSFIIQRQVDGGTWDNTYATVGPDVVAYTDAGLPLGSYAYRVVAHRNDDGYGSPCNSGPSNVASAEITSTDPPDGPTGLTAAGDSQDRTVSLAWTDNADNETGYIVQRRVGAGAWDDGYDTLPADATSYLDVGLAPETYTYRIVATNEFGDSSPSNEAEAIILDIPLAPTDLTATGDSQAGTVTLAWADHADSEDAFIIQRRFNEGTWNNSYDTVGADIVTYLDDNQGGDPLPAGTYTYRVVASNENGPSHPSNEASVCIGEESYDIVLKQGVNGYDGCRDAYLDSAYPTYNYGGDQYNYVQNSPKINFAIAFALPEEVQGMRILSATLGFYCWTVSSWSADQHLDLYRITEAWEEGTADGGYQNGCASWLVRSSDGGGEIAWSVPGGTHDPVLLGRSLIPNQAYYPEFDITEPVQAWADGSSENLGVLLKNDTGVVTGIKASEYSEYGRPYLTITYTLPSRAPEADPRPSALRLLSNYPNPASPTTAVRLRVDQDRDLRLCIYSLDGRRVATLLHGTMPAGEHEVSWNGADDRGQAVEAGIYFARLGSRGTQQTIKIVLAR